MSIETNLGRRSFLKGIGATIALPMLESLQPTRAMAGTTTKPPVRMAYMFVPNGVNMERWTPKTTGANYDLPFVLEPLADLQRDMLVLSGLTHDKGRANGDGAGDHARSAGVFLTATQPLKSEGSQIRAGVSVDQFAAKVRGAETRFGSLEIGTEPGRQSGKCDSGYSCAYSNNISWRDEATPMAKEVDPRSVFERLFANELRESISPSLARRRQFRKSILDFVLDDARTLNRRVGQTDKHKLDEYLTAVREIEQRIEQSESENSVKSVIRGASRPSGIPTGDYEKHIRLMGDMMVLAFQTDVTRIATFMIANAGSNRSYSFIGINEGHHQLSHHQSDPEKLDKISRINRFHVNQLAYMLRRMKEIKEFDGSSLLDNSMIVYGSAISDGNKHNNENLPILLAGKGGGTIDPGRHIRYRNEIPMSNLFLSMLDRFGVSTRSFADSTGGLRGLTV